MINQDQISLVITFSVCKVCDVRTRGGICNWIMFKFGHTGHTDGHTDGHKWARSQLLASDIYALFLFLFTSNHNIISHFSFPAVRFKTELPLTEPVPVQELVGTVKVQLRTERKPPNFCVRSFTTPQFNLLSLSQVGSGVVATINSWGSPTVAIVH